MKKEELRRELEAIRLKDQSRRLSPKDIVDAARDPNSKLHGHFDWNNKSASRKFLVNAARDLLMSAATGHGLGSKLPGTAVRRNHTQGE